MRYENASDRIRFIRVPVNANINKRRAFFLTELLAWNRRRANDLRTAPCPRPSQ